MHQEFTWEENVTRLVEATNNIVPTGVRFQASKFATQNILLAVDLARSVTKQSEYSAIETTLTEIVRSNENRILAAAEIDNVNERGNRIEQIITAAGNFHSMEDLHFLVGYWTESTR